MSEMTVRSIGSTHVSGVLHQQLLPISDDKCGSHKHSRLFGVRVRSRLPLHVLDRSNVRTRVKNNDETKCKIISV